MSNSRLNQEQTLQGINSTINRANEWEFHGRTIVPETVQQDYFEADLSKILEQANYMVDERGNLGAVTTGHYEVTDDSNESYPFVALTTSWIRIPNIDQYPTSVYADDIASIQSNQGSYYENPALVDSASIREANPHRDSQAGASQNTSQTTRSQSPRLNLPSGTYHDSPLHNWAKTYERHEAMGISKATHKSHESRRQRK